MRLCPSHVWSRHGFTPKSAACVPKVWRSVCHWCSGSARETDVLAQLAVWDRVPRYQVVDGITTDAEQTRDVLDDEHIRDGVFVVRGRSRARRQEVFVSGGNFRHGIRLRAHLCSPLVVMRS